jgi:hypothetical protein
MGGRRVTGRRQHDVFDGYRDVGRIYFVEFYKGRGHWFWGMSFKITGRKSFGYAPSLEEAKVAFRMEYERWQSGG